MLYDCGMTTLSQCTRFCPIPDFVVSLPSLLQFHPLPDVLQLVRELRFVLEGAPQEPHTLLAGSPPSGSHTGCLALGNGATGPGQGTSGAGTVAAGGRRGAAGGQAAAAQAASGGRRGRLGAVADETRAAGGARSVLWPCGVCNEKEKPTPSLKER